jgi:hypothetical protein
MTPERHAYLRAVGQGIASKLSPDRLRHLQHKLKEIKERKRK